MSLESKAKTVYELMQKRKEWLEDACKCQEQKTRSYEEIAKECGLRNQEPMKMSAPFEETSANIAERLKSFGRHCNKDYVDFAEKKWISANAIHVRIKAYQQYLEKEAEENTDEMAEQAKFDLDEFNKLFTTQTTLSQEPMKEPTT